MMKLPKWTVLLGLMAFSAGLFALAGCDEEDENAVPVAAGDPILGPLKPGEKREYKPDAQNPEYIIVTRPDGTVEIVLVDDLNRHLPGSNVVKPGEVGRTPSFPGPVVEVEDLDLPDDRLPPELFEPLPEPVPPATEYTEEILRERQRRRDEERAKSKRFVVVTEQTVNGELLTVIWIYDGNGKLIAEHRKKGKWKEPGLPNEATGEKTILTDQEEGIHWILFDYVTGKLISESVNGLDPLDEVVDIETVGGNLVVITKINNGTWIRLRIFGSNGTLLHAIDLPGEYLKSITNGSNVKLLVSEKDGVVYQDVVVVATGQIAGAPGVGAHADNGTAGKLADLEFVRIGTFQRFVGIVYDEAKNETVIQLRDANGKLISTRVVRGKFRRARVFGNRKLLITDFWDNTDVTVIDPLTGDFTQVTSLPGRCRRISGGTNGRVQITTVDANGKTTTTEVLLN